MNRRVEQALAVPAPTADSTTGAEEANLSPIARVADVMALTSILGRKWTPRILLTLGDRPMSHGELSRRLSGVQRKVMQESLDRLLADALVKRILATNDVGRATTMYGLTNFGTSLLPLLDQMAIWCEKHFADLTAAQQEGPQIVVESQTVIDLR